MKSAQEISWKAYLPQEKDISEGSKASAQIFKKCRNFQQLRPRRVQMIPVSQGGGRSIEQLAPGRRFANEYPQR